METDSFFEKYELVTSSDQFENQFTHKSEKTCKFCGKSSSETTFTTKPHVIPELLGKNNFTSNEECDLCNKLFGRLESSFANYIGLFQTLIGQRTKNKIPKFQSRKKGSEKSTTMVKGENDLKINFGDNLSDFDYNYEKKVLNVKLKKKKFIPIHVYKGLVKIGMSLCPDKEIGYYQKTLEWLAIDHDLLNPSMIYDLPLTLFRTLLSNKYYTKPSAYLYKRIETCHSNIYIPKLCLVVNSGVLSFQIFIPFCDETSKIDPTTYSLVLPIFPTFLLDLSFPSNQEKIDLHIEDIPIKRFDMNHHIQVEEDEWLTFQYAQLNRKSH